MKYYQTNATFDSYSCVINNDRFKMRTTHLILQRVGIYSNHSHSVDQVNAHDKTLNLVSSEDVKQ